MFLRFANLTEKFFSVFLQSSSIDCLHGVAVPTPKVPLLPPVNGHKINGSG